MTTTTAWKDVAMTVRSSAVAGHASSAEFMEAVWALETLQHDSNAVRYLSTGKRPVDAKQDTKKGDK